MSCCTVDVERLGGVNYVHAGVLSQREPAPPSLALWKRMWCPWTHWERPLIGSQTTIELAAMSKPVPGKYYYDVIVKLLDEIHVKSLDGFVNAITGNLLPLQSWLGSSLTLWYSWTAEGY